MKKQYRIIEDFNVKKLRVIFLDTVVKRYSNGVDKISPKSSAYTFRSYEYLNDTLLDDIITNKNLNACDEYKINSIFNLMFFYDGKLVSYRTIPLDNTVLHLLNTIPRFDYGDFDVSRFWS